MARSRRKRRKRTKDQSKNRHHVRPKSRCECHLKGNVVVIDKERHAEYHKLFGNMLPEEIIPYLVNYYWNGQWHWVEQALEEKKNDKRDD